MNWIERLCLRRRLYGELSDEIRAHLEEKIAELAASPDRSYVYLPLSQTRQWTQSHTVAGEDFDAC
jgi:hypothetical protein